MSLLEGVDHARPAFEVSALEAAEPCPSSLDRPLVPLDAVLFSHFRVSGGARGVVPG
jgi:hypothetical protein